METHGSLVNKLLFKKTHEAPCQDFNGSEYPTIPQLFPNHMSDFFRTEHKIESFHHIIVQHLKLMLMKPKSINYLLTRSHDVPPSNFNLIMRLNRWCQLARECFLKFIFLVNQDLQLVKIAEIDMVLESIYE